MGKCDEQVSKRRCKACNVQRQEECEIKGYKAGLRRGIEVEGR